MNEVTPATPPPDYKDRHGCLIGLGLAVIAIGCVCLLFVPLLLFGQLMTAQATGEPAPARMILPALVTYGALAVAFIWLGIGSILARRWARALMLVLAWSWLAMGVISVGIMGFVLPEIFAHPAPGTPPVPAIAMPIAMFCMTLIFILIPGVLVLGYRGRQVKATCEARDPRTRWTDACPLPVLALSLFVVIGVVSMLSMIFAYNSVLPCFGRLASGPLATLALVIIAAAWSYGVWGCYRLRSWAWWLVVLTYGILSCSAMVTFMQVDLIELYRLMGYPEAQIAQIQQFNLFKGRNLMILSACGMAPFFGYLLYVRRYFR